MVGTSPVRDNVRATQIDIRMAPILVSSLDFNLRTLLPLSLRGKSAQVRQETHLSCRNPSFWTNSTRTYAWVVSLSAPP